MPTPTARYGPSGPVPSTCSAFVPNPNGRIAAQRPTRRACQCADKDPPMNRLTLRACGENRLTITSIDGVVREFAPVEGDISGPAFASHRNARRPRDHVRLRRTRAPVACRRQRWSRDDTKWGLTQYGFDRRGRLKYADKPDGFRQWRRPTATGAIQQAFEGEPQKYGPGGVLRSSDGIEYEYDAAGRRSAKQSDDFRKRDGYHWDDRDRLVAITSSDGRRVDFAYDALNRRVKKTAVGVETVYIYDGEVLLHVLSTKEGPITWMFEPGAFAPIAKLHGRCWQLTRNAIFFRASLLESQRMPFSNQNVLPIHPPCHTRSKSAPLPPPSAILARMTSPTSSGARLCH